MGVSNEILALLMFASGDRLKPHGGRRTQRGDLIIACNTQAQKAKIRSFGAFERTVLIEYRYFAHLSISNHNISIGSNPVSCYVHVLFRSHTGPFPICAHMLPIEGVAVHLDFGLITKEHIAFAYTKRTGIDERRTLGTDLPPRARPNGALTGWLWAGALGELRGRALGQCLVRCCRLCYW